MGNLGNHYAHPFESAVWNTPNDARLLNLAYIARCRLRPGCRSVDHQPCLMAFSDVRTASALCSRSSQLCRGLLKNTLISKLEPDCSDKSTPGEGRLRSIAYHDSKCS